MTEVKERVFNVPQAQLSSTSKEVIYSDLSRVLYFVRIAQLHLVTLGKSQYLNQDLKPQKALEVLRGYDQKVRASLPENLNKSLTAELGKDKVYDISNFVELAAKINGPVYETVMSNMVDFLEALSKSKINLKKYNAIFRFLTDELKAENGGETAMWYDEKSDSITFNLVQPKPRRNATKQ